jgi:hypothetical protein
MATDPPRGQLKEMAMSTDVSHLLVKLLWDGFAARALALTTLWHLTMRGGRLLRKV